MKRLLQFFLILFCSLNLQAQIYTYYSSINTGSPTFITDLEARIRSPYTIVSYKNFINNVEQFASRDTTGGKRVVTCIYSGENYVYTPPFAWTPTTTFSREHTYCQSWWPNGGTTSDDYGCDQHHLFPINQNQANGIRSNHPLGEVVTATYTYLECKLGQNAAGSVVFTPRASHRGDAARALLYMALKYNGVAGDWTFNHLNTVTLPTAGEGPEEIAILMKWHKQDPPNKWEVDRNNYVQSVQSNRNPFIDHPEYVNYIDFNTLTKLSPVYAAEPDSNVYNVKAVKSGTTMNVSWSIPQGAHQASGYLLMVYDTDDYYIPIDGETYANDTILTDSFGRYNILQANQTSHSFSGLDPLKTYYVRMYSFNGDSTARNYKIDGVVASANTSQPNGVTGQNQTPITFSLEQNYPNPFNPSTTISYNLPASGGLTANTGVMLKVFDLLGNEVRILVNEEQAAGNYRIEFNAAGLASGIYFYRLHAGNFTASRKMTILK